MRRLLLTLVVPFALFTAGLPAGAAAAAPATTGFTSCAHGLNGTKSSPAEGVFFIRVRGISCATAYRRIRNFPQTLKSTMHDDGFLCTYHYSEAVGGFAFLCVDGRRAYEFDAAGE
jgi:hypothetical protein